MAKRKQRRTFTPAFKFKVALEAVKERKSINEIAAEYKVAANQVSAWKKELKEGGSALFERKNARNEEREEQEKQTARLERTLGRTVVERDFLLKKCEELGIDP